jgi:hypothetical protein
MVMEPSRPQESDETAADRAGWVRLGVIDWKLAAAAGGSTPLLVSIMLPMNMAGPLLRDLPGWAWIIGLFAVGGLAVVIGFAVARLRVPQTFVNLGDGLIRARGKTAPFSDITTAELVAGVSKTRRSLVLVLKTTTGIRAPVLVRGWNEKALSPELAALAGEVIRRSNIAMPVSKDDPKGRFARFNFPLNVSKDEAAALVADPPRFGDPIPIPDAS